MMIAFDQTSDPEALQTLASLGVALLRVRPHQLTA
jgi:hypothetical protein